MAYTTPQLILDKVGVQEADIGTAALANIVLDAQAEVDRIIKTTCNPKQDIIKRTGNNKNTIYLNKIPLLTVKEVIIDSDSIDMEGVHFNKEGAITLLSTADKTSFYTALDPNVIIKYFYAWLEESNQYVTSGDVVAGDNIEITLDKKSDLNVGDWIRITGTDGYEEWTKIKTIDSSDPKITCDLVYPHNSGSLCFLGVVPRIVQKLTSVIGAIMGAVHMMGSTYTFATSYSVPDHSVTKGVPYPHFVKVLDDLVKERDFLLGQIAPYPTFA